jgi:hypothetical protein
MRKTTLAFLAILLIAGAAALLAQEQTQTQTQTPPRDKSKMILKVGDEIFACNCGESCPCKTLSRKEGNCACGNSLVKANVKSVGEGTAVLDFGDREETFPTVGKYMCDCGPECQCDTIGQTPGKCACGKDMVEVKKK